MFRISLTEEPQYTSSKPEASNLQGHQTIHENICYKFLSSCNALTKRPFYITINYVTYLSLLCLLRSVGVFFYRGNCYKSASYYAFACITIVIVSYILIAYFFLVV